jgi:hypothetical protein
MVEPRMSRDFLITFSSNEEAITAEKLLNSFRAEQNNEKLFSVDNRGEDLFVMLIYGHEMVENFTVKSGDQVIDNFEKKCAFVAIKNGEHNSVGYFVDTGSNKNGSGHVFPLTEIPKKIEACFS